MRAPPHSQRLQAANRDLLRSADVNCFVGPDLAGTYPSNRYRFVRAYCFRPVTADCNLFTTCYRFRAITPDRDRLVMSHLHGEVVTDIDTLIMLDLRLLVVLGDQLIPFGYLRIDLLCLLD